MKDMTTSMVQCLICKTEIIIPHKPQHNFLSHVQWFLNIKITFYPPKIVQGQKLFNTIKKLFYAILPCVIDGHDKYSLSLDTSLKIIEFSLVFISNALQAVLVLFFLEVSIVSCLRLVPFFCYQVA